MEQVFGGRQEAQWRVGFQRKYLSRLAAVLRHGKLECATSVSFRGRAVKMAADLSLAMTTKGRSRWSRAILGKYIFHRKKSRWERRVTVRSHNTRISASAKSRPCKGVAVWKKFARRLLRKASKTSHSCEEEAGSTVTSRMDSLRLLVPGGHRLETVSFLKEAADYIAALKMQVQAMQALADCYTNSISDNIKHDTITWEGRFSG